MMKIKTKDHYLLYIDMLGTQKKVLNDNNDEYLKTVYELYQTTLKALDFVYKETYKDIDIKCKIFSDNIVLAIEKKDDDGELYTSYKKGIIADFATFFQSYALQKEILTRGAITIGKLCFDDILIHGEALVRAYQLESKVAIYPRVIYDSEIAMSFIQENDRREKTNRDIDGIFYIDIFKSLSYSQKLGGALEDIKIALQNIWCDILYKKPYKDFNSTIGKPKEYKTNYKHLQKINWLISVYNNYCQTSNQDDLKISVPDDKTLILCKEGNCYYDK